MKTAELLEGKWVAKSIDGVERRFKKEEDADAWRQVIAKKPKQPKPKDIWDDDYEDPTIPAKPSDREIWNKFEDAVGNSFPDGDPFDRIYKWMEQHRLSIDDIDRAVSDNSSASSAHRYLAQMWDDTAGDAQHDAMNGHYGDNYDDEWFARPNPWK